MRLYIVSGAPTLFYQQGNQNSRILSYLASALHYMGDEYVEDENYYNVNSDDYDDDDN